MKKSFIGLIVLLIGLLIGVGCAKEVFGEYNNAAGWWAFILILFGILIIGTRLRKWIED